MTIEVIISVVTPLVLAFIGWLVKQISDNSTVTKSCFEKLTENIQAITNRITRVETEQNHLSGEQSEMREMMVRHTREEFERQVKQLEQMTKITELLQRSVTQLERLVAHFVEHGASPRRQDPQNYRQHR